MKTLGRVGFVEKGTWSNSATYDKFDVVTVAGYGSFRSRTNNNKGHNPTTDTTNWAPVASGQYAKEQGDAANSAAAAANAAAGRTPYIGENGNWYAWDVATEQYVDTEVPADPESTKENLANKTTTISDESTDEQYPSAAAVRDWVNALFARKNGTYDSLCSGLSKDIKSWASRQANVESVMSDIVRTTAGDESVDSGKGAAIVSITPKNGDFKASSLVATGFNLLNGNYATQIGSSGVWYFAVPQLTFGAINTSAENNGVLFTDSEGNNLKPTVYLKDVANGVPTSATDGVAASYTDAGGYRFFTTPASLSGKICYMIVSNITRSSTCAHIGWSGNYDKYVSPTDSGDGGTVISLSSLFSAIHATEQQALWLSPIVCDIVERVSGTSYRWTRKVSITTPTWTTVADEVEEGAEQTYTHTATITGMLTDGLAALYSANDPVGTPVSVAGNVITVQDGNSTAPSGKVKFQLATIATGTITLAALSIEDWGLEAFTGAVGDAEAVIVYSQGFPDAVAGIVTARMNNAEDRLLELAEAYSRETPDDDDMEELPKLCGQPRKLYAAGSPAEALVPDNWVQLADGGYNWTGLPSAIGQEYIDTESGVKYEAVWNNYTNRTLKWLAV